MTSSVYDIQGKPIKVGYLVAVAGGPSGSLVRRRVESVGVTWAVALEDGRVVHCRDCVVLEEPVWPNK